MRDSLGTLFIVLGGVTFVVFGLWSFVLDLTILVEVMGFFGAVLGVLFFPVTLAAAPWYAGVAYGYWFPLLLGYGGGLLGWALLAVGCNLQEDRA